MAVGTAWWAPDVDAAADRAQDHIAAAARLLATLEPAAWRGIAAGAFTERLSDLRGAVARAGLELDDAEAAGAVLAAELAAARDALAVPWPWWVAR